MKRAFLKTLQKWKKKERRMFEALRTAIEQPDLMMNVYNKKDKRYLYLIINLFLSGDLNENNFCSEYNNSYDLELDFSTLTEKENQLFFELSKVVSRFSEYPEDHQLDPKAFASKEELRKKIFETKYALQSAAQT